MRRLIDVVVSFAAILVFLPLMAVIAVLVRGHFGSSVFFRQQRPGLHGEPFELVKFRTMLDDHVSGDDSQTDAERLTRFGQFLRSTSLDELPELWNVLRGDMSLVGPRPLLTEYLPLYSAEQMRRHEVLPGITGWAQVNGRNRLSWEDRFALDVWYVDNRSFRLDTKIILLTILQVFRRDGISAVGEATMPRFTGSKVSDGL
jgi:lipopolysaccharide/colanic/teichoic acid biosynthesis glycosyltransferase